MRGLKSNSGLGRSGCRRRTPRGVRGLKLAVAEHHRAGLCRTPRGVRGLKYDKEMEIVPYATRRTPRGVRGLKFV